MAYAPFGDIHSSVGCDALAFDTSAPRVVA
jgi:hypothetical protein